MKITTTREQMLVPLQKVSGVVERRQTLPILSNVLISATEGKLSITATDLEVEMKTVAECQTDGELDFTLPARKLLDICKALPEGTDMQISVEGERAVLRAGRGRYALGVLPAPDYPVIEAAPGNETFDVAQGTLKRLLDKTQFAMAQQDVRYYLNGLLLEADGGHIRTVATDGHRLALNEADIDAEVKLRIILPRKAVLELYRLLTDTDAKVRVEVSPNHARFYIDDSVFTTKLIDGKFPDYERVIPGKGKILVKVDRELLRHALMRASILSNEKYRGIRFQMTDGLLQVVANNPEQEEAQEEMEVEYKGGELTIGFNVGYLLDVLGAVETDVVSLSLVDANSSCLIQSEPVDKSRYVIMPMRL